jgi:hypothetical protein
MTHRATAALILLAVGLMPVASPAVVIVTSRDVHDDRRVVARVEKNPEVEAFRREVEGLRERLLKWKERDFHALFGDRLDPEKGDEALMVVEARALGIPFHDPNPETNRQHRDAYAVGDVGRLDVYFGHDGESPMYLEFRLKTDPEFPRLDRVEALAKRLAWERPRFARLVKEVDRLWRRAVVWEIDPIREKEESRGLGSGDFAVKLRAAKRWGEERGYTFRYEMIEGEKTPSWMWLQGEVVIAAATGGAIEDGAEPIPDRFSFYRPDGSLLREEIPWMIRWYRGDGEKYALVETGEVREGAWRPSEWTWYDRHGDFARQEADTNGDGLPDVRGESSIVGEEHYRPLAVDQSWAVHPERIPEDLRELGQPERRVPIRKIPG